MQIGRFAGRIVGVQKKCGPIIVIKELRWLGKVGVRHLSSTRPGHLAIKRPQTTNI